MKVHELITMLQALEPDMEVRIGITDEHEGVMAACAGPTLDRVWVGKSDVLTGDQVWEDDVLRMRDEDGVPRPPLVEMIVIS